MFNFLRISDCGTFTKIKLRKFYFFFSSAIIIIIFAKFLNSRICPIREIRENKNRANTTIRPIYYSTYILLCFIYNSLLVF